MKTKFDARKFLAQHSPLLILIALLAVVTLVVFFIGSPVITRLAIGILINVVLVVGLYIFIGNSGILSFGHIAFVGLGAYFTAWVTMRPMMKKLLLPSLPDTLQSLAFGPIVALVTVAAAVALIALISGAAIMRLTGIAAAIGTLAFLAIFNTLAANANGWTGGVGSLAGVPTNLNLWGVFIWAVIAVVIAHLHARSKAGLALRAVREDEAAATACGIRSYRVRLLAYVLSAFVCGIAGNLQARFLGVLSPDSFYLNATFIALTMLIIGGMFSLSGAVFGVLIVSVAVELLVRLEGTATVLGFSLTIPPGTANLLVALAMCIVLVKRPLGLVGDREWTLRLRRRVNNDGKASNSFSEGNPNEAV
ncbi:branched-chain amino acid ABC transporter permease [Pseudomonas sp. NPDC088444]|uniref:branched-chain amino acid ABC transporter permease n=1 Tax=Pseudomonas sp. NPDC088444 TaxID=3364456 RepID=UPI00384FC8C9